VKLTKLQLDQIIKEELNGVLEEQELNEVALPGVAWFARSYQWTNELLKVVLHPRSIAARFIPESLRAPLQQLADLNQKVVEIMDELYNKHPKVYMIIMGPIIAVDPAGAASGKAKEVVLRKIYDGMVAAEKAGELKQIEDKASKHGDKEQWKPTSEG
jgi:hypothetical protein